jgi:hypothetical protein
MSSSEFGMRMERSTTPHVALDWGFKRISSSTRRGPKQVSQLVRTRRRVRGEVHGRRAENVFLRLPAQARFGIEKKGCI